MKIVLVKKFFLSFRQGLDMSNNTKLFRRLISGAVCFPAPGVFDGFSARLAERTGAQILHASGGAISRAIGYPDRGLVTMTEMLGRIDEIIAACDAPVFADADTGFGNTTNAARTARCYHAAGVAGLHVEDQTFPKRCGHMSGVTIIPAQEMADKINAMKNKVGDDMLIAARTDAVSVEGLGAALHRMKLYVKAGADMAFVEGITNISEVEAVAAALPSVPLVFNQANASSGGAIKLDALAENAVRIALYPGDLQRGAGWAIQATTEAILKTNSTMSVVNQMFTNAERDSLFDQN
jgi:2-methylisocitrate lyase-like PEP mutase family enzyme